MSRFQKLSHVLWHCQSNVIWLPKYRYRVLTGKIGFEVDRLECKLVELNIQKDHVHMLIKVPPTGCGIGPSYVVDNMEKTVNNGTEKAILCFNIGSAEPSVFKGRSFLTPLKRGVMFK